MLKVVIPPEEVWNEYTEEFEVGFTAEFEMEHSLYAISKWEEKYLRPFFGDGTQSKPQMSPDEIRDYIFMAIVSPKDAKREWIDHLTPENLQQIKTYLETPHTASKISKEKSKGKGSGRYLSAELIYSYMVGLRIPFECQYWNIDRLFILIEMVNEQNQPPKKMSKEDNIKNMARLNKARKSKLHR